MKTIDVFYQAEGLGEVKHLEIETDATFAVLKARLAEKHGFGLDILVFLEDEDDSVAELAKIMEHATPQGLKVHLHRLRQVKVTVAFNGKTVERHFSPSATIARVKRWAAEKEFGMSAEEAGEHVLQIEGTHERPSPGTHVGTLSGDKVRDVVAFDLVPDERVQGAPRGLA